MRIRRGTRECEKGKELGTAARAPPAHKSLLNLERYGYAVCRVIYQDSLPNITVE